MERRHDLVRRARLGALALVVVVAAVACGSGPVGRRAAATVDGREISAEKVQDLLRAQNRYLAAERDKAADAQGDTSQLDAAIDELHGVGADTFSSTGAADALSSWITYELIQADLARHGEKVTDEDREQARSSIEQQVGGPEELKKLDAELVDFSIDSAAAFTAIGRVAAAQAEQSAEDKDAELRALYEQTRPTMPLCLRMILTADEAGAQAARDRIEAGEDFGDVAAEVSTDQASAAADGFLGCADAERAAQTFGADFSSVAVGDLVGPIAQADGAVLLEIASLTGPTFEQIRPQLEQQVEATRADPTSAYLAELFEDAEVTVDPRYGTWNPQTGEVEPPVFAEREQTGESTLPAEPVQP